MRRILKILIVGLIVFFTLLGWGYALVTPVRGFVDDIMVKYAGDTAVGIWQSSFVQTFIVPWPNQILIGMLLMIPIAWFWHRNIYNRVRGVAHRSALTESGGYPLQTKPISQHTTQPQPKPISKTPTPAVEPTPPPEPTVEKKESV